jgi:hypothetical protein
VHEVRGDCCWLLAATSAVRVTTIECMNTRVVGFQTRQHGKRKASEQRARVEGAKAVGELGWDLG